MKHASPLALMWVLAGCPLDTAPHASASGDSAEADDDCARTPALTYANTGKGLIGRHCRACHNSYALTDQRAGAPLGIDFDTYDDVVAWAQRIYARSIVEATMPPAGGLEPREFDAFEEWLRCDLLDGRVEPPPAQDSDPALDLGEEP